MAKIRGVTSMQYPQLHQIPKDARIRILTGYDDEHFYETSMPEKLPCPLCETEKVAIDIEADCLEKAFAPFPCTFQNSIPEMILMQKAREVFSVNALEIVWQRVPIPQRKKKSWLRYTSNKKWARKFSKRLIRKAGDVKVLQVPKSFMDKLAELQAKHPLDAAYMDGLTGPDRG